MANRNLVYVHRTKGAGVEGVHINGIVNGFRKAGVSANIISPAGTAEVSDTPSRHIGSGRLLKFVSLYTPELIFEMLEILYNAKCYLGLIGEKSVTEVYERYAFFAFAGALFSKRKAIPFLLEVNYFSGTPLVRKRSRMLLPLAKRVEKYVFTRASRIITVSSYLKEKIMEEYGLAEDKFLVQPNAVDLDRFDISQREAKPLKDSKEVTIGFVGGFYPWHGLDFLLEVFGELLSTGQQAKLVLIGDGPERLKIETQVNQLNLQNKVSFIGAVSPKELPSYLKNFDIGVMPNSNDYGSPMKIFEYMAAGVPVVAPDYSPILDAIKHRWNGFIFQRNNVESFLRVLQEVIADDSTGKVAEQARQDIKTKLNWDAHVSEILSCLEQS